MKEITVSEFIETYKPLENTCTPYVNGVLKTNLGDVIWDKRDYTRIASHLKDKDIWTVFKIDEENYHIAPGIYESNSPKIVGFVVTFVSYESNDIGNLRVILKS